MPQRTSGDRPTALVAGVSGIAGSAVATHLSQLGWTVYGLSRGHVKTWSDVHRVTADLSDARDVKTAVADLRPTHVFYTAWKRHQTEAENIAVNGAMVRNLLDALAPGGSVQHVALLTGLKHYVGPPEAQPVKGTPDTPFREDEPRLGVDNFYYAQEDETFAAAERQGFTWSVHRAHTIIGHSVGNAMNMGLTLAVQAAICREERRPFVFPGSEIRWNGLGDMTDADLLARHMTWASTAPKAGNEAYNVVNGDVFRWRSMWPRLAEMLDVDAEGFSGRQRPLTEQMMASAATWTKLTARHNLVEPDVQRLASWWHTDGDLGRSVEMIADMSKSRVAGFTDYVRTEDAFRILFERYRQDRIIP